MKLILLELNEINFDIVNKYLESGEQLDNFEKLFLGDLISTSSEKKYSHLEPWIQWASVHTGKTFEEHKIFRLGDIADSSETQIFEKVEKAGFKVGAISPMNTKNNLINPAYFVPDPWTNTLSDNSLLSRMLSYSISQAVNDNAQSKITFKTLVFLSISLLISLKFIDLVKISFFAATSLFKPWRKALFLDLALFKIHQYHLEKKLPNFSTLFLNAGAHIQHHYFFNSKVLKKTLKNPKWYIYEKKDPVLDMLKTYDFIIGELLKIKEYEKIIATGLSQEPYDKIEFYYRLKNHNSFLNKIGLNFKKVYPRMTRDFLISFDSNEDALEAEKILSEIKVNNKDKLFGEIDNRGKNLFVTLTFDKEIFKKTYVEIKGKKINVFNKTAFVAIKNGMHHEKGYAFFTNKISSFAPSNYKHVKNIHGTILNYFNISN